MADALEAVTLEPKDGQLEAGIASTAQGRARWCQHCDTNRLATDMRWTLDGVYACRWCLGPGVGTPELWVDTTSYEDSFGAYIPVLASAPRAAVDPWWTDDAGDSFPWDMAWRS